MAKTNGTAKVLEGLVAGVALGVAASMFLATKKGKELTSSAEGMMADFYKYITPKIKKMKKMGKSGMLRGGLGQLKGLLGRQ